MITYSDVQPQVYKRVRVTRVTRKFARESCTRACARHASDEQSTRVRYFTSANTRNLSRVLASTRNLSRVLSREYSQSLASTREYFLVRTRNLSQHYSRVLARMDSQYYSRVLTILRNIIYNIGCVATVKLRGTC